MAQEPQPDWGWDYWTDVSVNQLVPKIKNAMLTQNTAAIRSFFTTHRIDSIKLALMTAVEFRDLLVAHSNQKIARGPANKLYRALMDERRMVRLKKNSRKELEEEQRRIEQKMKAEDEDRRLKLAREDQKMKAAQREESQDVLRINKRPKDDGSDDEEVCVCLKIASSICCTSSRDSLQTEPSGGVQQEEHLGEFQAQARSLQ